MIKHHEDKSSGSTSWLFFFLGAAINQSQVILNTNVSISEALLCIIIIYFTIKRKLLLPIMQILFFFTVMAITLSTSFFITPLKFSYYPAMSDVIRDALKLTAALLYAVLGFNLSNITEKRAFYRGLSFTALIIAAIGTAMLFVKLSFLESIVLYGGSRFKGLMNDPNYYAVITITAIPYFIHESAIKKKARIAAILILITAIMLSGSKTGVLTLLIYLIFEGYKYITGRPQRTKLYSISLMLLSIAMTALLLNEQLAAIIGNIMQRNLSISRLAILFRDIDGAISAQGSSRLLAWEIAVKMIIKSPITGIGIGTYSPVALVEYGSDAIAHNTYLQITVEWGLFLASAFILYLIRQLIVLLRSRLSSSQYVEREILLILLVGSVSISLNNARLLWLILGMLMLDGSRSIRESN